MAISPIGFNGASTMSNKEFKDLVNEMPAHRRTDLTDSNKPLASTRLNSDNQEESHWVRNTLIGTGVVLGGAFLLRQGIEKHSNWFHTEKDATGPITWIKRKLNTAGEFVDKQWNKVKNFFSSEEKAESKKTNSEESK